MASTSLKGTRTLNPFLLPALYTDVSLVFFRAMAPETELPQVQQSSYVESVVASRPLFETQS